MKLKQNGLSPIEKLARDATDSEIIAYALKRLASQADTLSRTQPHWAPMYERATALYKAQK